MNITMPTLEDVQKAALENNAYQAVSEVLVEIRELLLNDDLSVDDKLFEMHQHYEQIFAALLGSVVGHEMAFKMALVAINNKIEELEG